MNFKFPNPPLQMNKRVWNSVKWEYELAEQIQQIIVEHVSANNIK